MAEYGASADQPCAIRDMRLSVRDRLCHRTGEQWAPVRGHAGAWDLRSCATGLADDGFAFFVLCGHWLRGRLGVGLARTGLCGRKIPRIATVRPAFDLGAVLVSHTLSLGDGVFGGLGIACRRGALLGGNGQLLARQPAFRAFAFVALPLGGLFDDLDFFNIFPQLKLKAALFSVVRRSILSKTEKLHQNP